MGAAAIRGGSPLRSGAPAGMIAMTSDNPRSLGSTLANTEQPLPEVTLPEPQKRMWDRSYNVAASRNLWGDPPVPFVSTALELFGDRRAWVADIPCGDGRN